MLVHVPMLSTSKCARSVVRVSLCRPKLNVLAIMLDASMQEIVDRWNTEDGALAKSFTAIEMRGFIKAVSKNTERRAKVVAKITICALVGIHAHKQTFGLLSLLTQVDFARIQFTRD